MHQCAYATLVRAYTHMCMPSFASVMGMQFRRLFWLSYRLFLGMPTSSWMLSFSKGGPAKRSQHSVVLLEVSFTRDTNYITVLWIHVSSIPTSGMPFSSMAGALTQCCLSSLTR